MGKTIAFFLGIAFLIALLALWPDAPFTGADITG